jgi:hypothetical protein
MEGLGGVFSAGSQLEQNIRALLFVCAAVAQRYGTKAMPFVKALRTDIGWECVETYWPRKIGQAVL